MPTETTFKTKLIDEIRDRLGYCVIIKISPANQIQGFPDLLILYCDRWAALETKKTESAYQGPNQAWWVDKLNGMSYSSFIYPENKDEVLDELQRALQRRR